MKRPSSSRVLERAAALNNEGLLHRRAGRLAEAERALRAASRLEPRQMEYHYNLANLLRYVGRLDEAEAEYLAALARAPDDRDAKVNLSNVYLAQGRYELGWPLFDERMERRTSPANGLSFPQWRGEPLAGRSIFIWPEQGYGDQIQCARFAKRLKELGAARVTLCCHPPLARLFGTVGADVVLPLTDPMSVPRHDFWTLPFSAARYLIAGDADIGSAPYLSAEPTQTGGVGLVWKGNQRHANDANRSLAAKPDIEAIDLQGLEGDFADSASVVAGLDLVITVDTSMAHLAGALGKPCWVMLPFLGTDWRWQAGREDSPWYGSVRLFRQETPGDWPAVIARVCDALEAFRN